MTNARSTAPIHWQYADVAATKAGRGLIQEAQSYCLQMGMVNNETIFVPFSSSGEGSGACNFVLSSAAEEKMNAVLRVAAVGGGRRKGSSGGVSCVLGSGCMAQLNLKSIPPWKVLD